MTLADLVILLPYLIVAASSVLVLLVISVARRHGLTASLSAIGLAAAIGALPTLMDHLPRAVTPLFVIDRFAFFYTFLVLTASLAVVFLAHAYLEHRRGYREEFYALLLMAALGAGMLTAARHFASFFLGLEVLTVSLYAMIGYLRDQNRSIEAGVKYLILAAVSSAFILFGMSLVYAATGALEFGEIARSLAAAPGRPALHMAGFALILTGVGFKLAVVPFHLWTPDVYEGAPAPVTAFVATVSKGAVFAALLRFFSEVQVFERPAIILSLTVIAAASMLAGNLLALLQKNVKRILAYSSIAHLGYLLVAFLAAGPLSLTASAMYLTAYMATSLGAFGVVTVLSGPDRDADELDDYRGLAWRRPAQAAFFTAMLLSLAGMPLTAGFIGKFLVVAAGVESSLWLLASILVLGSIISIFYYLRIIMAMYADPGETITAPRQVTILGGSVLVFLAVAVIWIGLYPGPMLDLIREAMVFK